MEEAGRKSACQSDALICGTGERSTPAISRILVSPPASSPSVGQALEQFANRAVPCEYVAHGDLLEGPKGESGGRSGSGHPEKRGR